MRRSARSTCDRTTIDKPEELICEDIMSMLDGGFEEASAIHPFVKGLISELALEIIPAINSGSVSDRP